jgi:hypothetical protein
MDNQTIEKAKSLLANGYNMNQIASILTVDRVALSVALMEKPKTIKSKEEPLSQDTSGL